MYKNCLGNVCRVSSSAFPPVISLSCALLEKTLKRKFKHFLIKRINIRSFL